MDPNETLRVIRESADSLRKIIENIDANAPQGDLLAHYAAGLDRARTLASHVWALDQWLSKGGFLPEPWQSTDRKLGAARILRGYDGAPMPVEPLGPPNPAHGELPEIDHVQQVAAAVEEGNARAESKGNRVP